MIAAAAALSMLPTLPLAAQVDSDAASDVVLSSGQQRVSTQALSIDVAPETATSWPTAQAVGTIERRTACPTDPEPAGGEHDTEAASDEHGEHEANGADDGHESEEDEEYLIVTVNGGSALLLSFGCRDGTLRASSSGWFEGNRSFQGRTTAGGGHLLDFDYRNYLIAGAATAGQDQVEVRLEADADYRVTIDRLDLGADVPPGSTTELAVVGKRVEQRSSGSTMQVDVEFRSDRAETAVVRLVEPVGVAEAERVGSVDLRVVDGIGRGTFEFEAAADASMVGGVLVAETNGFNTPAVAFEFDRSLASSSTSENLATGGFGLVAAALAALAVVVLRPVADDHRMLFPALAIVTLLALPVVGLLRVLAGDVLADSGGTWWVVLLYLVLGLWAVAFFLPALFGSLQSPDPSKRRFVALAAIVTLGLGAIIGAVASNLVVAVVVLYPPLGLATTWLARSNQRTFGWLGPN